ncbi:hypothetical protein J4437_00385 [Candidatus Woesearchaeota archaeon]|nr:hypothetical protein [Candidatus Woesearchaeota archaeon]
MGIFDKLAFWKKDELDFDQLTEKEMSASGKDLFERLPEEQASAQEKSPFAADLSDISKPLPFAESPSIFGRPPDLQKSSSGSLSLPNSSVSAPQNSNRDIELLNSKLDTIKAMLTNIDQRLNQIERPAEKKERLW